jgi:uncharacterized membrane protein YraQ (UPF0718 family)
MQSHLKNSCSILKLFVFQMYGNRTIWLFWSPVMTDSTGANVGRVTPYRAFIAVSAAVLLVLIALFPAGTLETAAFVARSMVSIAPLVIPGILLSAWVSASGAGAHVAALFGMRPATAILAASAVGAITPVCGVTVLPLMAGLLASGVPLAPVMAFWLSSPVTDPAMLTVTAATLGWEFAIAKTAAAFGLGLFGGLVTAAIRTPDWTANPLRRTGLAARLSSSSCGEQQAFGIAIWRDRVSRRAFVRECVSITRLVTICLVPAFAAEYMLNALLQPESLTAYVGSGTWWSIPLAVFVGAPAYIDGYAALPLTRGLIDAGMSPGAAMAFLVSGSVVSIWGAMAIFPVLRVRPFLLYLGLAVTGSLAVGFAYEILAGVPAGESIAR